MFGGSLSTSAVVAIEQCDLLVAAFSHQLYLFSLSEATLKDKVGTHRHPILHLLYHPSSSTLHSVDTHGLLCSFRVGKHAVLEQLEKKRLGKKTVKEAVIRPSKEADVEVLLLSEDGILTRHVGNCQYLVDKAAGRILLLNDQYLVISKQNSNNLQIFSAINLQKLYSYVSPLPVTSVEQYMDSLIIGNQQGKIIVLVGFLKEGTVQLQQKLQWHVHAVSCLRVDGSYLYSAGEEGVVVVWHLRQNKRDFLPRIGSGVSNIQLINSTIYCFLNDNSIKSIDLANDKALLHYKIVINPNSQLINQQSQWLVKDNLIRVSHRADRLFMRGASGKIQDIDLHSGINTEHSIVSRNYISRLDKHLPSPHQLTDICLSKDNAHMAVVVQGIACRSLRFFTFEGPTLKLTSKVQNCHLGSESISVVTLSDNRFLSYSFSDSNIKVWKLTTKRKESMLQIDEHFWCCQYQIAFRQQLPRYVSVSDTRIVITYQQEFILFNTVNKSIEGVHSIDQQQEEDRQLVGVVAQHTKFLIFYDSAVELASTFNNSIGHCQRLLTLPTPAISYNTIILAPHHAGFALLIQQQSFTDVYYWMGGDVSHLQIPSSGSLRLSEVFWLKERLMGLDSSLFFYDLTHERELVQLQAHRKESLSATEGEQMEAEQGGSEDSYQQLYRRYLQRQSKKDQLAAQRNNEIVGVTPSVSACLSMLTPHLFL